MYLKIIRQHSNGTLYTSMNLSSGSGSGDSGSDNLTEVSPPNAIAKELSQNKMYYLNPRIT